MYSELPLNLPSGNKIYQHFPFQCPTKHQLGIFGTKLAILPLSHGSSRFTSFVHCNPERPWLQNLGRNSVLPDFS
jgi:hypothetical protein